MNDSTKRCTRCRTDYPATTDNFYRQKGTLSGLRSWCKDCVRNEEARRRSGAPLTTIRSPYVRPERKRCTLCRQEKPLAEFHLRRLSKDGRLARCKECQRTEMTGRWHKKREEQTA